jgi:hypothetical protein
VPTKRMVSSGKAKRPRSRAITGTLATKCESGVGTMTELDRLAFEAPAQSDPAAAFLKRTRGRLGKDHALEY